MDLTKILEKKRVEASDSNDSRAETYKKEHLVKFKGYLIPREEYNALEKIALELGETIDSYKTKSSVNSKKLRVWIKDRHITGLQISRYKLKSFPAPINNLTNLQKLDLWKNKITEIKGLESLTNLQTLYLRWNKITEIKGLETLTNLKELYLSWNIIREIKGLENLTNLKELHLDFNRITEIEGLENLANLKKLDLKGCKLNRKSKKIAKSLGKRGIYVVRH